MAHDHAGQPGEPLPAPPPDSEQFPTLERSWKQFWQKVRPAGVVPANQEREMKRAFMGGAFVLIQAMKRLGEDDVPEMIGVAYMQSIEDQCHAFYAKVKQGLA